MGGMEPFDDEICHIGINLLDYLGYVELWLNVNYVSGGSTPEDKPLDSVLEFSSGSRAFLGN